VSDDAIGTPSGAPVPEVPEVAPVAATATVTLDDVQRNPELSLYIASADRVMDAMGYTEHGFRHAHLVGKIAYQVLHRLGFSEREAELARVAGYLHDMGNALSREGHAQSGAVLAYQALKGTADGADLMTIVAAIANHEEAEGTAVSPVSAAVILADKADVHRSRVRKPAEVSLDKDIHDRVNYAVEQSFLRVDSVARTVSLELTIDTRISQVMEYFEIFLGRMQMCRHAAEAIDAHFQLFANGQELA
jgi:metal-dependent HD superfamily phosphatase/phosphodiesterase